MSADDGVANTQEQDADDERFTSLRAQLSSLPKVRAPRRFDAELERRLARTSSPLIRIRWMHPVPAILTAAAGIVVLIFVSLPGHDSPDKAHPVTTPAVESGSAATPLQPPSKAAPIPPTKEEVASSAGQSTGTAPQQMPVDSAVHEHMVRRSPAAR